MQQITSSPKKIIILFIAAAVACVCLYYVAISFDWQRIWQVLMRADWVLFGLGSILTLCSYWLLRALRWRTLVYDENARIPFAEMYLYTAVTTGFSTITPFQSGEALKVEWLRRHGVSRVTGYAAFAVERTLDLIAILILALIGLNGELSRRLTPYIYSIILGLAIVCLAVLSVIFFSSSSRLQALRAWIGNRIVRLDKLILITALTFASWLLVALGWKIALNSIAIDLNVGQTLVVLSMTTIAGILSFVPGAIGVSEVSSAQILIGFGYEAGIAQAGALILRGYAVMILALAAAHLIFLRRSARFSKEPLENNKTS